MTVESEWNEEMGMLREDAEAWAAQPRTTVEQAMVKWMESQSSREWEQER